jgi:hypothetical protein
MKRLTAITGVTAMLLLPSACAVTAGHASARGTVTGRLQLQDGMPSPGTRQTPASVQPMAGIVQFTSTRYPGTSRIALTFRAM